MVRWIHASFAYQATNSLLPLILAHAQMPDDCERGHALNNRTRVRTNPGVRMRWICNYKPRYAFLF